MARKYPITAEITTITTNYLRFDPNTKKVVTDSTESVKEFTDEDMFEKVTLLRKIDFYAVYATTQEIERKVKYGMTEDVFYKIAHVIPKDKRRGLLSRSKKQSTAKYSSFDEETGKFEQENKMNIPLDVAKKPVTKVLEYIRKEKETAKFHILAVTEVTQGDDKMWAVDRKTFKMNAVKLTKEEAEEADEVLEDNE